MSQGRIALIALVVLLSASCAPEYPPPGPLVDITEEWKAEDPTKYGDTFDWDNLGPLEFLDRLREGTGTYVVVHEHGGWVKEEHLSVLVSLLDSDEPCMNVKSVFSSFLETAPSTVGNEAAYLINGFRKGEYPPGLNSTRPRPNKEEIREWWSMRGGA
jgi:hypothetical protein